MIYYLLSQKYNYLWHLIYIFAANIIIGTFFKLQNKNLPYGKPRPDWDPRITTGRPVGESVKEVSGSDGNKRKSSDSSRSGNSKPGSREGRTIKIINNLDKSQEVCWFIFSFSLNGALKP